MFGKKRIRQLEQEVQTLTDQVERLIDTNQTLSEMRTKLEEDYKDLQLQLKEVESQPLNVETMTSQLISRSVPTFVLSADDPDTNRGLKVSMDWNQELIDYLIANMSTNDPVSNNDESLIQRWLITLCEGIIRDMEVDLIEHNSEHVGEDYK